MSQDKEEVLLGLPGDLIGSECVDYSVTKVGGMIILPKAANLHAEDVDLITCPHCKTQMTLLLQAYAPLESPPIAVKDRVLCVFMCMDQKCSQCCKVCRAIRVQVAPASEDKEGQKADEDEEDVQVDSGTHEDCSDSWWTDTSWTEVQTDEAKLEEDVVNALEKSLSLSGTKKDGKPSHSRQRRGEGPLYPSQEVSCSNSLPGFYIQASQEPSAKSRHQSKLDIRVKELTQIFLDESKDAGSKKAGGSGDGDASGSGSSKGGKGGAKVGAECGWAGEAYESAPEEEKAFAKFLDRVSLEPSQCVRYCRGGTPLCPSSSGAPRTAEACQHCGGPREFEMQIMSPIMAYVSEAVSWKEDESSGCGVPVTTAQYGAADFVTVLVYTCAQSCYLRGEEGVSTYEEQCIVQYEP